MISYPHFSMTYVEQGIICIKIIRKRETKRSSDKKFLLHLFPYIYYWYLYYSILNASMRLQ